MDKEFAERGYKIEESIGSGSFSEVFRGKHTATNAKVAIKIVAQSGAETRSLAKEHIETEINILTGIHHPLIAELYEVIRNDAGICAVMEWGGNRDLETMMHDSGFITEQRARELVIQLLFAVDHLHRKCRTVHRDIKLENILLDAHGNIKLIDFGFAERIPSDGILLPRRCGTPAYAAPEVICGDPARESIDVWSIGVILFIMVTGDPPFWGEDQVEVMQQVALQEPVFPAFVTHSVVSLLKGILEKDPAKRMTIPMILEHPWISRSGLVQSLAVRFQPSSDAIDWTLAKKLGILRGEFQQGMSTEEYPVEYKILKRKSEMEAIAAKPQRAVTPMRVAVKYAPVWSRSNENQGPRSNALTPQKIRLT